ncbi:hypothetical protein SGFS_043900 [Streptomyces graminofaciens]|uniref:DUF4388 domain-containing protein n=1 Tax=Streptomyces graminofaciens TaxID=68212 RepID=A0ABM7FAR7_9ACTN|nr:hypothetical protein [Streptomyces graminofaciens]BBC33096.1 hypothetical protein SGFS_043900 [Streptomyces graminofaciens]
MKNPSARNVPALLQALREEGFDGTVRVSGSPGGTIHLRDGLVGAIETPGAPTATSALLASGRIDDEAWLAACAAQPDADRLGSHLVAAGLIGAGELDVVCTAAVYDGAFAMALSPPGGWELTGREPTLVARPGVEPRTLAEETTRRMTLLSRLWGPAGELARVRPARVGGWGDPDVPGEPGASGDREGAGGLGATGDPDAPGGSANPGTTRTTGTTGPQGTRGTPKTPALDGRLTRRHLDLVESANGRRTPRDIAFARGRGLYAVMLDLIRLESFGVVQWETRTTFDGRPSTAPRVPQAYTASQEPSARAGPLPRRRPGGGSPADDLGAEGGS